MKMQVEINKNYVRIMIHKLYYNETLNSIKILL